MSDIAFSRVDDLLLGNGELYVSIDGDDVEWRHLGNADEFIITTTLEDIDKYSSMNRKRELMSTEVTEASITASVTLTEFGYHNLAAALFGEGYIKKQTGMDYIDVAVKIDNVPGLISVFDPKGVRCFGISGISMRPKTDPYPCVHWVDTNNFGSILSDTSYNDTTLLYNSGGKIKIDMANANVNKQAVIYVTILEAPRDIGDLFGMKAQIFDGLSASLKNVSFNSGQSETITLNSGIELTFSVDNYNTFGVMSSSYKNGIKALAIPIINEFKENVDYIASEQDRRAGIVKIPKSTRIRAGDEVYVSCIVPEKDLKVVYGGTGSRLSGRLLYVPDSSAGPNYVLEAWKVHIKPEGDLAGLISSGDFGSYKLDFKFLADYENHPDSPYYSMTLVDYAKNNINSENHYDSRY